MIKINLLVERKAKARGSDAGAQLALAGLGVLAILATGVYFVVHRPLVRDVEAQHEQNADLEKQNEAIRKQTADLSKMQNDVKTAQDREGAIERLRGARSTPAWMLWEISNILTRDHQPTVSPRMQKKLEQDPNLQFSASWDPKKVWLTEFTEKNGSFKMMGGAQTDTDYVQLALRLKASMFFEDVQMEGATEESKGGSSSYYNFIIVGKVRY